MVPLYNCYRTFATADNVLPKESLPYFKRPFLKKYAQSLEKQPVYKVLNFTDKNKNKDTKVTLMQPVQVSYKTRGT